MKTLMLILMLLPVQAYCADWLCTEESSQRSNDRIQSCGVGLGLTEDEARESAFINAKKEFINICESSDDCKGHAISTKPQRTSCAPDGQNIKCYRLVEFTIGNPMVTPAKRHERIAQQVADSEDTANLWWANWTTKYMSH